MTQNTQITPPNLAQVNDTYDDDDIDFEPVGAQEDLESYVVEMDLLHKLGIVELEKDPEPDPDGFDAVFGHRILPTSLDEEDDESLDID